MVNLRNMVHDLYTLTPFIRLAGMTPPAVLSLSEVMDNRIGILKEYKL